MRGNDDAGGVYSPFDGGDFTGFNDEETYGATFGGPLIKDRLSSSPTTRSSCARAGHTVSTAASAITDAQIAQVPQIAQNTYGFDAGNQNAPEDLKTGSRNTPPRSTEHHRHAARLVPLLQAGAAGRVPLRFQQHRPLASTNWSVTDKAVESYVGQLFSDWTDNFSTELKVSYREYSSVRNPFSRLPSIGIGFGAPLANGTATSPFLNFGTEVSSHVNVLETETTNVYAAGSYFLGDHEIKFGFDYEDNGVYNVFGQNLFGSYTFASIADFQAGRYSQYSSNAPRPGLPVDSIAADYNQSNLGVFIQDRWAIGDNLSLMFGVRADRISLDDTPEFNELTSLVYGVDIRRPGWQRAGAAALRFQLHLRQRSPDPGPRRVRPVPGAAANVWIATRSPTPAERRQLRHADQLHHPTEAQRAAYRAQFPFSADPDDQPQPAATARWR